jgi:chromosome segregation ATPase
MMAPRNKSRRNEASGDWETSEAEENYTGSGNPVSTGDRNNNGHASKNASSRRSRQSKGSSAQHEHQPSLGPWTQAVSETVRTMGAAQQAIRDLENKFTSHKDDLSMMDETRNRLDHLEESCRDKDEKILKQEHAIIILKSIDEKTKTEIERKQAEIEKDRQSLDQEVAKQKKRVSVAMEEEKHKLESESAKRLTQHDKSFDKRKKELEAEFAKQKDENNRRVTDLESERDRLRAAVEESKQRMKIQGEKLEKADELCDVLTRAKDSVKSDKKVLEKELDMMKKEFALSSKSKDHL